MGSRFRFILASASPARRSLLETVGIQAEVQPSRFDESTIQTTNPVDLVRQLAFEKARLVAQQHASALVLGCDSVMTLEGEIFGKPRDRAEAIARWRQMRGRAGELYTGHALFDLYQNRNAVRTQKTLVEFALTSDRQIEAYVDTREPLDCAGGFALDGKGGLFVEQIQGCHSNVIGLSLPLLRRMLADFSYDVTDFWHSD
ncbi:Maf family protein [Altericista sp. CCNU0014]|uniref:Maf family protein n=1 Tax=Altericista sp. CCNU0014 TaxID=3082949 RepID=UPI00384AA4C2